MPKFRIFPAQSSSDLRGPVQEFIESRRVGERQAGVVQRATGKVLKLLSYISRSFAQPHATSTLQSASFFSLSSPHLRRSCLLAAGVSRSGRGTRRPFTKPLAHSASMPVSPWSFCAHQNYLCATNHPALLPARWTSFVCRITVRRPSNLI